MQRLYDFTLGLVAGAVVGIIAFIIYATREGWSR